METMRACKSQTWLLAAGLLGLVSVVLDVTGAHAQVPGEGVQKAKGPTKRYFGVAACRTCHTKPADKEPILSRCIEVPIWEESDKHKDANKVLLSERAKQIGKLLGMAGDVAQEKSCITCHGVFVENKALVHETFKLSDGVSCAVCHGPYEEWVDLHGSVLKRKEWRSLSRKEKEEKYGMFDLWDPVKRTRLCVSCHVGNWAEGKVVTHAMYAAGHPPLPSFEVATFSNAMPRHWQYLREKSPQVQKILNYDPKRGQLEESELVVVGSLTSLQEAMNLLASSADAGGRTKNGPTTWPELAAFDCFACHHDLKSKSWRQQRGYYGRPGRPQMRPWLTVLAELALQQAAGGKEAQRKQLSKTYPQRVHKIYDAFNAQPFGQPQEVASAARELAHWLHGVAPKVRSSSFDRAAARRLLWDLAKLSQDRLLDYDSAREVAWAFTVIFHELYPKGSAEAENAEINKLLESLNGQLQLTLPVGQVQIMDFLPTSLRKLNAYEPTAFRQTLGRLAQATRTPPK
jgi:hypothetical protein